ncbi:type III pantothenate kinase [Fimbriiglobus ruber]|uniref:Type III pantothenate kinase n=1 Tax=Fimbriiglobus ruber TaxID=1908690 RepID=A0A225DJS7_9BACT|nr:type III pantothenate kinase [Fimbriiglobus ruber]OWK36645.1 Pantothenate kinase type III, CoaX-like [Fimbriiglobus ruber]
MTPDVVVDVGNSRIKWGWCRDGRVAEMAAFVHDDPVGWKRQLPLWNLTPSARWAVAGVVPAEVRRLCDWLSSRGFEPQLITNELFFDDDWDEELDGPRSLGFVTRVDEPARIGTDRLLNALAARDRAPDTCSAVALSVGTAITLDFVEPDGTHVGGAILPGPRLMAKSLRDYTAKLPEIAINPVLPTAVWGANTEDAIALGIANAVLGAADQMIWDWAARCAKPPWVFATGGDVGYFRGFVFTADLGGFVIDPHLTLDGIRLAARALP